MPPELGPEGRFASLLVARRPGGVVIALPDGAVAPETVEAAADEDYPGAIGPHTQTVIQIKIRRDQFTECFVELIDLADDFVAGLLKRASIRSTPFEPFREIGEGEMSGSAWPSGRDLVDALNTWKESILEGGRISGYNTAMEDLPSDGGRTPAAVAGRFPGFPSSQVSQTGAAGSSRGRLRSDLQRGDAGLDVAPEEEEELGAGGATGAVDPPPSLGL